MAVLALAAWWLLFFWRLSPVSNAWGTIAPAAHASLMAAFNASLERADRVVRAAAGDLICLVITVFIFWLGTHSYVRRLRVWLEARGSGQALSFGSTDLGAETLAANQEVPGVLR
jgi:hypothetical protein